MVCSCGMRASGITNIRSHASDRTSLRQIRSYSAWKRRSRLRLAAMYSLRWSSRTFSMGWLGLATMPSRLPPGASVTKAGSLPSASVIHRLRRYYEPLGLPPDTIPFHLRFIGTACADVAAGTGLSCSVLNFVGVPSSVPRRRPASFRFQADAVCCLRRDMNGSATSPFRGLISRGCKVHFMLGPLTCSPPDSRTTI